MKPSLMQSEFFINFIADHPDYIYPLFLKLYQPNEQDKEMNNSHKIYTALKTLFALLETKNEPTADYKKIFKNIKPILERFKPAEKSEEMHFKNKLLERFREKKLTLLEKFGSRSGEGEDEEDLLFKKKD